MRLLALACLLTLGCSGPAPVDEGPRPWRYTRDSAIEQTEDDAPGPMFDTATAPDAAEVGQPDVTPEADAAPPDTSPPVCYPAPAVSVCTTAVPLTYPCGKRPDGCGGTVACDACPTYRRCVTSPGSLGHCSCKHITGPLCLDKTGVYVGKWECGKDDVPMHPDAALFPQPDGSVSVWCVPSTAY